jgi:hypothetical protein
MGRLMPCRLHTLKRHYSYQDFRDVLAEEIKKEFPELESYVDEVIENTGGLREPKQKVQRENRDKIEVD